MATTEYNVLATIDSSEAKKGSDQVVVYLDDIRKKAFKDKKEIQRALDYDTKGTNRSLGSVEDSMDDIAKEARNMDKASVKSLNNISDETDNLRDSFDRVRNVAAGISATFLASATAVLVYANNAGEAAREIEQLSAQSGTGVEEFQKLAYAFRTVGVEQDKMADIFKDAQDRVGDYLQNQAGPMTDYFENVAPLIGQTAEEFKNLSGAQVMEKFIKGLKEANLSQSEMIFHLEAMASDSSKLIPLIDGTSKSINELGNEAKQSGVIISEMDIEKLSSMKEEIDKFKSSLGGNMSKLLATFSEEIETMASNASANITGVTEYIIGLKRAMQDVNSLSLDDIYSEIVKLEGNMIEQQNADGFAKFFDSTVDIAKRAANNITEISSNITGIEPIYEFETQSDKAERFNELLEVRKVKEEQLFNSSESLRVKNEEVAKSQEDLIENKIRLNLIDSEGLFGTKSLTDIFSNHNEEVKAQVKTYNDLQNEKMRVLETIQSEISTMKQQVDTFGMSNEEIVKYRSEHGDLKDAMDLGIKGIEDYADSLIRLQSQMSKKEAFKSIKEEVSSLNTELAQMTAGSEQEKIRIGVEAEFSDEANALGTEALDEIINKRNEIYRQDLANSFVSDITTELSGLEEKLQELESVKDLLNPEAYEENKRRISESIRDAKIEADDYLSFMRDLGSEMRGTFSDVIFNGLEGDWSNMFDNLKSTMNRKVADILADQALNQLMNMFSGFGGGGTSTGGGIGSFISGLIPGRASGGWMHPNKVYQVGERGTEIIKPDKNMYVDNGNGSNKSSGGGLTINFNGNIEADDDRKVKQASNKISSDIARQVRNSQSRGDI